MGVLVLHSSSFGKTVSPISFLCNQDPYLHGVSIPPACYAPSTNGLPNIKMVSLRAFVMLDRRAEVGRGKYKSFSKSGQIEFIFIGLLEVRNHSRI
jgi:hypothetical protein